MESPDCAESEKWQKKLIRYNFKTLIIHNKIKNNRTPIFSKTTFDQIKDEITRSFRLMPKWDKGMSRKRTVICICITVKCTVIFYLIIN